MSLVEDTPLGVEIKKITPLDHFYSIFSGNEHKGFAVPIKQERMFDPVHKDTYTKYTYVAYNWDGLGNLKRISRNEEETPENAFNDTYITCQRLIEMNMEVEFIRLIELYEALTK